MREPAHRYREPAGTDRADAESARSEVDDPVGVEPSDPAGGEPPHPAVDSSDPAGGDAYHSGGRADVDREQLGHRERRQRDQAARNETATERLDRNWEDLLQELRVVQTGVQLLTGLLFTAAFQQRFVETTPYQHVIYLVTLMLSTLATAALIAPVALHRALFRRHARRGLVAAGQWFAQIGLALLALAVVGVALLIFSVVLGAAWGIGAGAVTLGVFVLLWVVVPARMRLRYPLDS